MTRPTAVPTPEALKGATFTIRRLGCIERIPTTDVLRAHSYVGARGWVLDKARPAGLPAALVGFRVVFGYRRRDGRRALLVRDARGALFLCELPGAERGAR